MPVTPHVYTKFIKTVVDKGANLELDALKIMLLASMTVGSTQDTAQFVSDVKAVAIESSGTGYTAGGGAVSGVLLTESGHTYALTGTAPTWPASSISAAFALLYDSSPGSDATNPVLGFYDLGGTFTSVNGTFALTANASGLLVFTAS